MRYVSIDILRALAIVIMVFVHFGENLAHYIVPLAGFGAPMFALLSGVGYRLWLGGRRAAGMSEEEISKISIRRGFFVFGVGFAFNILVWLPDDTFNWDVLTLIGSALVLLSFMRRMPDAVTVTVIALILLMSPLLRALAEYHLFWNDDFYDGNKTLADVVAGYVATGYFPLFPWLAYALTGWLAAGALFERKRPWTRVATVGGLLIGAGVLAFLVRPWMPEVVRTYVFEGWDMFPASLEYTLVTLGTSTLALAALHHLVDRQDAPPGRFPVATLFSRYSFTVYLLHHIVHLWPLWLYGLAIGKVPDEIWRNAMGPVPALLLAAVFLVLCYLFLRSLPKGRRFGMEAWMRWLCD